MHGKKPRGKGIEEEAVDGEVNGTDDETNTESWFYLKCQQPRHPVDHYPHSNATTVLASSLESIFRIDMRTLGWLYDPTLLHGKAGKADEYCSLKLRDSSPEFYAWIPWYLQKAKPKLGQVTTNGRPQSCLACLRNWTRLISSINRHNRNDLYQHSPLANRNGEDYSN